MKKIKFILEKDKNGNMHVLHHIKDKKYFFVHVQHCVTTEKLLTILLFYKEQTENMDWIIKLHCNVQTFIHDSGNFDWISSANILKIKFFQNVLIKRLKNEN